MKTDYKINLCEYCNKILSLSQVFKWEWNLESQQKITSTIENTFILIKKLPECLKKYQISSEHFAAVTKFLSKGIYRISFPLLYSLVE